MKITRTLPLIALAALAASCAKADVTINLFVGELFKSDGTTPIPDGSLIQLVASTTDSTFATPTAGSFTGSSSDDVVLASFSLDSTSAGLSGSFIKALVIPLAGNLTAGDSLMLRWFPTLTTGALAPGGNTICGQYRTDATLDGSSGAWIMPSDGLNYNLNFLTVSGGGSVANSFGTANLTAVPEPSTYGLLGAGAFCAALVRRRRKAA